MNTFEILNYDESTLRTLYEVYHIRTDRIGELFGKDRSFETTENYAFAHRENHSIKFLLQRPALETLEEFNL